TALIALAAPVGPLIGLAIADRSSASTSSWPPPSSSHGPDRARRPGRAPDRPRHRRPVERKHVIVAAAL
ncbi:hypothetical protein CTI14_72195, partial [Methylobacterium radiotolerans]